MISSAATCGLIAALLLIAGAGCRDAEWVGSNRRSAPTDGTPTDNSWWEIKDPTGTLSPDAKVDSHNTLLADLEAPRHPADGGGRAWLEAPRADGAPRPGEEPIRLAAGSSARFELIYEAGPLGVAEGGVVFLQISPFWGWDEPQTIDSEYPGYTEVSSAMEGLSLTPETLGQNLVAIHIEGRAMRQGERLRIVYGAGPAKARVDQFAGGDARLWIAVDGDGDGVRSLVLDSPAVRIEAGEPAYLRLALPTTLRPGEAGRGVLAFFDSEGNAGMPVSGEVRIDELPDGLRVPRRVRFEPADRGRREVRVEAMREGVFRLRVRGSGALAGFEDESNPLIVRAGIPQLLWGDLHGHSGLSDGTGTPEDYFRYARDVAGLDVSVLTDHDHWGLRFLDGDPRWWAEVRRAVSDFHAPGRFVTILGYEWTSWLHGHRHVLYFEEDGEVHSSIDPRTTTPAQHWQALRGKSALTFAHHSAGGPVATNWAYAPDPILEPVTEIVSVHGSSEALDSPGRIYNPLPGYFVRDTLDHGYRFGFIGSGDSHDGHPGSSQRA